MNGRIGNGPRNFPFNDSKTLWLGVAKHHSKQANKRKMGFDWLLTGYGSMLIIFYIVGEWCMVFYCNFVKKKYVWAVFIQILRKQTKIPFALVHLTLRLIIINFYCTLPFCQRNFIFTWFLFFGKIFQDLL